MTRMKTEIVKKMNRAFVGMIPAHFNYMVQPNVDFRFGNLVCKSLPIGHSSNTVDGFIKAKESMPGVAVI